MDAMEYLSGRSIKLHEVYTSEISLSFCASAYEANDNLSASVESIATIAAEIGYPYEIILVSSPGNSYIRALAHGDSMVIENFYHVKQRVRNNGHAMRVGYESSKGRFFIPFDAGTTYDIRYSDLIHSFIERREKKLFLSELPVIHRDLISESGGYRDLFHGHDIDLYSRIALMHGVIAYPALFNRVPLVSTPPTYGELYTSDPGNKNSLRKIMDHIIACNYDFEDIRALYPRSKRLGSIPGTLVLFLLFAASKLSRIKPYKFDRNNYLVLMENVFESLVLKDFERYGVNDIKANMLLTSEEIRYLKDRCRIYNKALYSINQYVIEV